MNVCMYVRTQLVYLSYIPWDVACPGEYFCLSPSTIQHQLNHSLSAQPAQTYVLSVCLCVYSYAAYVCVCA